MILRSLALVACLTALAGPLGAEDGEQLARAWCAGCHAFPEPGLLDRDTWIEDVLPEMGARLGFASFRGIERRSNPNAPEGVYASEPAMPEAEWAAIVGWYEAAAPEHLPRPVFPPRAPLDLFDVEVPPGDAPPFPTATAVTIDEVSHRLLVGDGYALDLELYGPDLTLVGEVRTGGAVSRIRREPSGRYLATTMGATTGQSEQALGMLVEIAADGGAVVARLAHQLPRPVDMAFGDFDGNGVTDYVMAGFGTHLGEVRLQLGRPDGPPRESTLLTDAGAIALAREGDDLIVLMAQADERLIRLKDFAGDRPTVETLRRFPPSYGLSSLTVRDVDGDGLDDLLVTAGDNADFSPVYKPYHGVYLLAGQADGAFRQTMFFHLEGAYGTVAEDFDLDGDVDIAAISYFPDLGHDLDAAAFVYLRNDRDGFTPMAIEGLGELGRFVAISAGDLDGDGDKDIALANLAFGPYGPLVMLDALQEAWLAGPDVVLLRNKVR